MPKTNTSSTTGVQRESEESAATRVDESPSQVASELSEDNAPPRRSTRTSRPPLRYGEQCYWVLYHPGLVWMSQTCEGGL